MTLDAEKPDLSWLAGQRVALVGKPGSSSRRQVLQLLKELGGLPVERCDAETSVIVVGADEGRDALARLINEEVQQRIETGAALLLHETELWQRLGLVEQEQDVRRLYTPALLAELVGVSVTVVRRWHRRGLLVAAREVHRLPYFDFNEVSVARRLAEMTSAGATTASIERSLAELQKQTPHVKRPLAELPTVVEGKQLLLWRDNELVEASGQRRFDFDAEKETPVTSAINSNSANPPATPEQLLAHAAELEEAGELKSAAEAYRAALAAAGPTPDVCFLLAELLYRQGDLTASRERYSMAIELDEDFVEARANLACVLAELGERDLALAALEGALRFHPDYSDAYYHSARLLDEEGRHDEARDHWRRFLELAPDSPWGEEARQRLGE